MRSLTCLVLLVTVLTASGVALAAPFRLYPGAKTDAMCSTRFLPARTWECVVVARPTVKGQQVKWAFFVLDGAKTFATSKH